MGDQETTAKAPKVAVIGAGLTGLLAAQGLTKVPQSFSQYSMTKNLDLLTQTCVTMHTERLSSDSL